VETWYRKTLGDGVAASAPSLRIQRLFPPLFAASGQPSSMAVFARHDREANRVTAYFSPRAAELAAAVRRGALRQAAERRHRPARGRCPQLGDLLSRSGATTTDSRDELKARALRYLARREHSRDELARKLAPHAESPELLEALLRELESRKQLSNERFAEARASWLARKYGAARIRQDLKSKGVS
jgi:hypothetical protein